MSQLKSRLAISLLFGVFVRIQAFKVPTAKIEVFYPKGFEVSILDEEGISSFGFHGQLSKGISGMEAPVWTWYVGKALSGRWTFRDREAQLKIGDILYYWISIVYNDLKYRGSDSIFVIKEFVNGSRTLTENGCMPTQTVINSGTPIRCAGQLIFSEHFKMLNKNVWKVENRFADAPDFEFVIYLDNVTDILNARRGFLNIKPKATTEHFSHIQNPFRHEYNLDYCTGALETSECYRDGNRVPFTIPPYVSAQLSTKDSFSFKYGRVEIRAKLPRAKWVYPELWLEPKSRKYGIKNYQSGQMRIAMSRYDGGESADLYGGPVLTSEPPLRLAKMCKASPSLISGDWINKFHDYTLTWTQQYIAVSVDNVEYCRIEPANEEEALYNTIENGSQLPNKNKLKSGSYLAPFDDEFYITLGYGIGGHQEFDDDLYSNSQKPWQNRQQKGMTQFWGNFRNSNDWLENGNLQIDYVNVYTI